MRYGADGQLNTSGGYESDIIKRTGQTNFKLSKGDVVIIKSDERNRASRSLGIVDELYSAHDNVVRAVKLRAGKKFLERPNHLYPLELSCDREVVQENIPLNPNIPPFRPARDAAVAAHQRIQEIAEHET